MRALLLALALAGCATAGQVPAADEVVIQVPVGAYRFRPFEIYETWLDEVNACAGTDGRIEDIEFYAVPRRWFFLYGTDYFMGYFDKLADPDRMYLVEHDRENEGLVKHEFLHQKADTVGSHPIPPYVYCAPYVYEDQPWRRE